MAQTLEFILQTSKILGKYIDSSRDWAHKKASARVRVRAMGKGTRKGTDEGKGKGYKKFIFIYKLTQSPLVWRPWCRYSPEAAPRPSPGASATSPAGESSVSNTGCTL